MKMWMKKLKSKAGESLVESLAAILIFTMASVVMYSMVTTAADINSVAKEKDAKIQAELVAVESKTGTPRDATINLSILDKNGDPVEVAEVSVDVYGGSGELQAYFADLGG